MKKKKKNRGEIMAISFNYFLWYVQTVSKHNCGLIMQHPQV